MTSEQETASSSTIGEQLDRVAVNELTFCAEDSWSGAAALWGPDLVDVNDASTTVGGSVHVDLGAITTNRFTSPDDAADVEDAIRTAVALTLAHQLHEIAEWLSVDGQRVFDAHSDTGREWQVITAAAAAAAEQFCTLHPRRADVTS